MWQSRDETERKFLLRLPEGEFFEAARQMRKAGNVIEVIERNMKAPHTREVAKKIEVLARPAVDVKLDVGPAGDEVVGPPQLRRRQRLIELDDRATRIQRPERISEPVDR